MAGYSVAIPAREAARTLGRAVDASTVRRVDGQVRELRERGSQPLFE